MRYRDAKKLYKGDEVTIRKLDAVIRICDIIDDPEHKILCVQSEDGAWYDHTAIK